MVEKVRINPGNYVPQKYNGPTCFDPKEKVRQLEKIHDKLRPLIDICKEHDTAIRIGVNHGSLSERILNWYGNTPEGMVASALEFLEIFRAENFDRIVLSLKASSVRLMVHANRLMAKRMQEHGMTYPLHLGVTEAGDEEEGRIKSATGICSLLADGIGDTLRVSLTEDPEEEIPVAKAIASIGRELDTGLNDVLTDELFYDAFSYSRCKTRKIMNIGGDAPPVVISTVPENLSGSDALREMECKIGKDRQIVPGQIAPDFIFIPGSVVPKPWTGEFPLIVHFEEYNNMAQESRESFFPFFKLEDMTPSWLRPEPSFLSVRAEKIKELVSKLSEFPGGVLVLELNADAIREARNAFRVLQEANLDIPVILHKKYSSQKKEEFMIRAAAEMGSLFLDGFGDGIWLEEENPSLPSGAYREICFDILQASSSRISKTEYIACPSCGRTLFNIQAALKNVKAATAGYKGLKIAVMGCIVNGPGEMADADFGYVGSGPGKITLYRGKKAVMKNIPEEGALVELLRLIEQHKESK
jgi:(E)-4-hydroxy-3-methylbut-2-enyl-diphosphate synthase